MYRPFDSRFIYDTGNARGFVGWPVQKVMQHFKYDNVGLVAARQCVGDWQYVFITKQANEFNLTGNAGRFGAGSTFPLYLYQAMGSEVTKIPNLAPDLWKKLIKVGGEAAEDPQAVFDYIYAVLHAPTYRSTYTEFLKSDFPRIPYPTSPAQFSALAALGAELRQLHLLEHPSCTPAAGMAAYPIDGSHVVEAVKYTEGKVYINATQHFADVPADAWGFYIGGYQPAQKWLKDRKGRALSLEDIAHYQRIISTLTHTPKLMAAVDEVYVGKA